MYDQRCNVTRTIAHYSRDRGTSLREVNSEMWLAGMQLSSVACQAKVLKPSRWSFCSVLGGSDTNVVIGCFSVAAGEIAKHFTLAVF